MMKFAHVAAALTMTLVLAAGSFACAQAKPETEAVAAPDFSITDLHGNTLNLAAYKGKVLVINFWATWCPPCRREIPDLIAAYKELKGEGLEIIGVSVDDMTEPVLLDWTRKMGINYPVAVATPEIIASYEPVDYIPTTIIVDRKGLIRFRQAEMMDKDKLVQLFRQYQ